MILSAAAQLNQKRLSEYPPEAERTLPFRTIEKLKRVCYPGYVSVLEHARNVWADYVPYARRAEDDHHYHAATALMIIVLRQELDAEGNNVYHAWWANTNETHVVDAFITEHRPRAELN